MRTFKQYIEEAADFRLGGKANKGVVSKTFSELKEGDKFYRYIYNIEENEVEDETERCFIKASEYEADGAINTRIEYDYFVDNGRKMTSSNQILNIYRDEDCSVFIKIYRGSDNCYIYSTSSLSEEEIQKIWREHSKEVLSYNNIYVICESVDFRLGGKSSKGDSIKSFSELKNGDVFYYYRVRKDGSEFTIDHYSKRIFLDAYETGKKTEIEYRIIFKDNSKLTSVCDAPNIYKDEDCYIFINVNLGEAVLSIISTRELSEDEIAYLYNDNQEKAHSSKKNSIIICESVDFRLGGKANKSGYRTFEELKPDDVIYEYTVDPEKDYVKLSKYKANSEEGLFLKRKKRENNLIADSSAFVAIGNKWFHTILYSTYELSREEAIEKTAEAMKNSKEWEYVKVEESVDFRLGGSQQKGLQKALKTFAELEEGDTFYAASIEFFDEDLDFIYTVKLIEEEKYANQICINIETTSNSGWTFPKKYVDDSSITWIDTETNATSFNVTIVVSTNLDEFLYLLRKNGVKESVIDACKRKAEMDLKEAYSFRLGGKGNKGFDQYTPIRDLKYGDNIYFYTAYSDESYECLVKKIEEDDEEEDRLNVDVIQDGKSNTLYVRKLKYRSPVCVFYINSGKVGSIFATDEELFLKTCEECGLKVTSKDIIRNEKF